MTDGTIHTPCVCLLVVMVLAQELAKKGKSYVVTVTVPEVELTIVMRTPTGDSHSLKTPAVRDLGMCVVVRCMCLTSLSPSLPLPLF